MSGCLRIVGVGPGDPELVTVKAARLIGDATAVVFFAKRGSVGHARSIVGRYLRPGVEEIRLEYPFTTEIPVTDPAYRRGIDDFHDTVAAGLAERLAAGGEIVLLCEGDPFFFGSSMHLFDRLRSRFEIEVVPGVSAMSGAWSQARLPIAQGDGVLSVLPGTLDDGSLRSRLGSCDAAVVMKVGRNLARIRAALVETGKLGRAVYVERATQAGTMSMPLGSRDER